MQAMDSNTELGVTCGQVCIVVKRTVRKEVGSETAVGVEFWIDLSWLGACLVCRKPQI